MKNCNNAIYSGYLGQTMVLLLLLCASFILASGNLASAAAKEATTANNELVLANPARAYISPNAARLEISQILPVKNQAGNSVASFVIPGDGENLDIVAPGSTIIRWDTQPVILPGESNRLAKRQSLVKERNAAQAMLNTVKARLAVWQTQTAPASTQDLEKRQTAMASQMPQLGEQQEELETKLRLLDQELAQIPGYAGVGKLVTITLAGSNKENVQVEYSYDLPGCGWQPVYEFDARAGGAEGDVVDMRFLAEVWQYSGIDWKDTVISLVTMGNGPREPKALPRWVVGAPAPAHQAAAASNANPVARTSDLAAPMMLKGVRESAPVDADTDAIYASWTLSTPGLPEGRSRMQIDAETWKIPLEWLARPSSVDNRVWLFAKYDLPTGKAWPDGMAQYSVDGQGIGNGPFKAKNGKAILYFGVDPRVTVHTTIDTAKQGETGFINTSKTWTGTWTYTLYNRHNTAINVRVERPAPMIANDNITVSNNNKPAAQVNDKEHMYIWNVTVPANGESVIQHGVIISSPDKLPLLPLVP